MHYNWQVLVMADSIDEAEEEMNHTMERIDRENCNGVWDYFTVGGRWNLKENIINGEHPEFWDRINKALEYKNNNLNYYIEKLLKEFKNTGWTLETWLTKDSDFAGTMRKTINKEIDKSDVGYLLEKVGALLGGSYISDCYFATSGDVWGSSELPEHIKEEVEREPKKYWLVNIDIHN